MKRQSSFVLVIALVMTAALGAQQTASAVADAAARGDKAAIRDLLKQGADVNAAQGDGMSALHWAAERGDAELADLLIYGGANTGAVTRIGQYTPLHLAAKSGSPAVVKALIKAGADVNAKSNPSGATPIHLAALAGSADVINLLADAKADLNAREAEWEQTPLIFAASANRAEAITTLIKRGADANLVEQDDRRHQAGPVGSRGCGPPAQGDRGLHRQGFGQASDSGADAGRDRSLARAPQVRSYSAARSERAAAARLQSGRDQPARVGQGRHDGAVARGAPGLHPIGRSAA